MTHYQRLNVPPDASRKDIKLAYLRLLAMTNPKDIETLAAIEAAYKVLSKGIERFIYDAHLESEAEGLELQNKRFPKQRKFCLWHNPEAFNHYEYINRLFALDEGHKDYLRPGQPLGRWDRNRLYWQLDTIETRLHAESEGLQWLRRRNADQQARLQLLQRNEHKITLCIYALATTPREKYLYDLALGPTVVQPDENMQVIAALIGGWEQMTAYLELNPSLDSATAIFALRKASCLTPVNFSHLMASVDSEEQLGFVADVINELANENLLNQANFEQVLAHSQFALPLTRGLSTLASVDLLDQSSFEVLLEASQYADDIASGWKTLKRRNLLNETNREMITLCAANNIGIHLLKCFRHLDEQKLFTPDDGLDFLWTGDTEELQVLSLRIDEMFAYGISLLCHDKSKAETVFLLAIELKKSLKNHFAKPLAEQRETEQQFKAEFRQRLHSQDAVMAEHRAYWRVIIANIAITFTGVGLLALGVYALATGRLFFGQTHREQLRDKIEESPWLLQDVRISA